MTESGRHHQLEALLAMIGAGDFPAAAARFETTDPDPAATRALFGAIDTSDAARLLAAITDQAKAREVLLWLPPEQSATLLAEFEPQLAAGLLRDLPSDERVDLLAALPAEARDAIQSQLPADARADAARLLGYPPDSAGGLMETELLAYPAGMTVREAIRDLRANHERYAAIGVQYLYIIDEQRRLRGVAPIRDLMLSPEGADLLSLVKRPPATVRDTATTEELSIAFDEHPFVGLPVVDHAGVLLGVVSRADASESEQHQTEDQYRVSQGIVGGEELRSMPVVLRLRRRTAWLGVNLLLCLGGAAVVAINQGTLAKAIVVAAVLPVVSATSGNAAMQAAAVSIRELTLGLIEPHTWRRVLAHEVSLAMMMAIPLGIAVALLARVWGAGWPIGLAVGLAMAINTLIAVGIGALCPLLLRRFRIDPALASGPISTTLADVSGFAITLTLVATVA